MRFSRCLRSAAWVLMAMGVSIATTPGALAAARPKPKPGQGFRLFSASTFLFEANRTQCHLNADGQECYTGSSTVGGAVWPKGTADQYVFATGVQIGGIVDPTQSKTVNGFAGDTAGAFLYNTSGSSNGLSLRPIFSSTDAADLAAWPDEARVPCSDPATTTIPGGLPPETIARCTENNVGADASGELFAPALQGQIAASPGDAWFIYWEGDPSNLASRAHPLGILVEQRVLGWNFPSGNQDIMYMLYTFYNVTSAVDDDYLKIRSSLRPFIQQKGKDFQALNKAKYGIALPANGYTIKSIFVDAVSDNDVGQATANYVGVNVPFALGYTYVNNFDASGLGWTFDPSIFGSAPFFAGVGFVGTKYLSSPINPLTGQQVGLSLFGTFSNSVGSLTDPNDDKQLYRYMTGHLLPTDGSCTLNPDTDKICSINLDSPTDMRSYQSSGPFDLAPGQFGSVVVAQIFAAPIADGNCPGPTCDVKPADGGQANRLTIMGDPARMTAGVNQLDRMVGYVGFNNGGVDDLDPTKVTQSEFVTRPGSLLQKALIAQQVFDNRFLLPFAPDAPEFFLVPGDNQVTVLWTRTNTETTPDPFFAVAGSPTTLNPDGSTSVNSLYNPNFRGLDVEGYRVYRGRTSNPSQLTMVAQFDYAPNPATGTGIFKDFLGTVSDSAKAPDPGCAPELAITTTCPVAFETPPPGTAFTVSTDIDLVGTITQVLPNGRVALADGNAQILPTKLDTAFADVASGRLAQGVSTELKNTGVPFIFVDHGVRNSVRYFYSVTAFDVNSVVSGPSSLESSRATKPVTPVVAPTNVFGSDSISSGQFGRDVELTSTAVPTIDASGRFSGPFPPANGATLGFVGEFARQLFTTGGSVAARLVGIGMGDARNAVAAKYTFTAVGGADTTTFSLDIDAGTVDTLLTVGSPPFPAATADPALAAKFGANGPAIISGQVNFATSNYQQVVAQVRGCVEGGVVVPVAPATGCAYNGPRWFAGDNETAENPNFGMANDPDEGGVVPGTNLNNGGALPGVSTIFVPMTDGNLDAGWRGMDASLGGAVRAADFKVYWGNPGKIDSVIDVTHNVAVPFMPDSIGGGFGVLNVSGTSAAGSADGRPTVLTIDDFSCVEPWRTGPAGTSARGFWPAACASAAPFVLSDSAELNSIALFTGALSGGTTAAPAATPGFILYIAGRISAIVLDSPTLPSATVWTLRAYTGWVSGGVGAAGDLGPYAFTEAIRPFTAIGDELRINFSVTNGVALATKGDLSGVHTVPDPYYVRSAFEVSTDQKVLKFVGLPQDAIIRIYSASGVLVRILEHHAANYSGTSISQGSEIQWDLRNRNNQVVASGVYFYHVEAGDARRVGRFTVVNFAQ